MLDRRLLLSVTGIAVAGFAIQAVLAAESAVHGYPSKPIRMVVPMTAGSATDTLARLIGPKLAENWGYQVVVDNRPSGGGTIAGSIVATAAPDGHTLLVAPGAFAGAAALYDKLPYDPLRDFQGVTLLASTPMVLVVSPSLGVKTMKGLIALARQKPGQLSYSSAGIASGTHYGGERFKLAAKIDVVHVPYKGTPEALNDVVGGRVQYMVASILPAVPLLKSGRLVALAITTPQRAAALPDVATVAELGLPEAECDGWYGVFAQSKTPRSIVNVLSQEIGRIVELPQVEEKVAALGAVAHRSTPEGLDKIMRKEIKLRGETFRAAGAKVE
jgi:tripartite-type tricarboxylate transporter receptor subunit TctC